MNESNRHIFSRPTLRTLVMENGAETLNLTGFLVMGHERERFEKEFSDLTPYNLDNEKGRIDDRITSASLLFYTPMEVKLQTMELSMYTCRMARFGENRTPTLDEIARFCAHPAVAQAFKDRTDKYLPFDVNGQRIATAEEWNAWSDWAANDKWGANELERRKNTLTAQVRDSEGRSFKVDSNLAIALQSILDAGFHTGQSDSGTVSDHPNYRYVSGKEQGENIPPGIGAYLTFWKPEAVGVKTNTAKQIELIRDSALATGWYVHDMPIYGQPSIRLCLPLTSDGVAYHDICHQATDIMREQHPELSIWDNLEDYLRVKKNIEEQLIASHGGRIHWTDNDVLQHWNSLSADLVWRMNVEQTTGWLTNNDVHSVLLDKTTAEKLEAEYLAKRTAIVKSYKPAMDLYHRLQAEAYDKAARNNGFDGYEENKAGTAVRNYFTGRNRFPADVQHRLDAFDNDRDRLMEPVEYYFCRCNTQQQRRLFDENQRYLQAIYAVTAPLRLAREDNRRLSDVTIYEAGPDYNRYYKIRCRIDGELQMGKELNEKDARIWHDSPDMIDSKELAASYFRSELDSSKEKERTCGLHR